MRTVRVRGMCLVGTEAELVTVEARFEHAERSRTEVVLTGLPDTVLRESRAKLVSALEETRLHLPRGRLFLNLHPAGRRKQGEALDLPLALAAAAASGHLVSRRLERTLFLGELGIDGSLHAVPGGLAAALAGRAAGLDLLVAPSATAREAAHLGHGEVLEADSLGRVVAWAATGEGLARASPDRSPAEARRSGSPGRLAAVRGQELGKRALVVAAAGGHGLLLFGPPGTGKTLLARALVELLPPATLDERLAITRILSALGRWPGGLAHERPFRAPHHTTSHAGLVGGGSPPVPGEITLAHGGVLFLDELPEFRREALEALRQPLEAGTVTVSRAGHRLDLPASFHLVAAMNPCPCGYLGHGRIRCRCSPREVWRYRRRVSGPLLDRIDLRVEIPPPDLGQLAREAGAGGAEEGGGGEDLRRVVLEARRRAGARGRGSPCARLEAAELDRDAPLDGRSRRLLARAVERGGLSARAVQSVRRVARTLADLEGVERVGEAHHAEALGLRAPLE